MTFSVNAIKFLANSCKAFWLYLWTSGGRGVNWDEQSVFYAVCFPRMFGYCHFSGEGRSWPGVKVLSAEALPMLINAVPRAAPAPAVISVSGTWPCGSVLHLFWNQASRTPSRPASPGSGPLLSCILVIFWGLGLQQDLTFDTEIPLRWGCYFWDRFSLWRSWTLALNLLSQAPQYEAYKHVPPRPARHLCFEPLHTLLASVSVLTKPLFLDSPSLVFPSVTTQ